MFRIYILLAIVGNAAALGFATYKELKEGGDNSGVVTAGDLDRSQNLFLYIQTVAGADHTNLVNDFKTLSKNWGSKDVGIIPRLRYGTLGGSPTTEPDKDTLMKDVALWSGVFASTVNIPVIQAGFLGEWGEWHGGQYSTAQGAAESTENQAIKADIVEALLKSGHKVALRYPQDHSALFKGNRTVTLHDDCIFNGGPGGYDGGTYPSDDRQTWVGYAKQVASDNTFGGEGCDDASDSNYDWSNYGALCGSGGLVDYINAFHIAYMNPYNPKGLSALFADPNQRECSDAIQHALEQWK